ncbi:hypothetical protein OA530_04275 [Pelagibacteraceae bacterium]|nr:hypothetical protein [Pelagibacteraceae bacterium]
MSNKYISFITVTRNDDYIKDQISKIITSTNILISKLSEYKIFSEIIFVEWNPDPNKKPLKKELTKIKHSLFTTVNLISVDCSFHMNLKYNNINPLSGERGANVGIRRASGKFIAIKAQDTLYSDGFYKTLSKKLLKEDQINIIERIIIDESKITNTPNRIKNNFQLGFKRKRNNFLLPYSAKSSGDSLILEKKYWVKFRGIKEKMQSITLGLDGDFFYTALGYGLIVNIMDYKEIHVLKPSHEKMFSISTKNTIKNPSTEIVFGTIIDFIKKDKVYYKNIPIGRKSFLFIGFIFRRLFKYSYLLKSEDWGLKHYNLINKELLSNKIIYSEIKSIS